MFEPNEFIKRRSDSGQEILEATGLGGVFHGDLLRTTEVTRFETRLAPVAT